MSDGQQPLRSYRWPPRGTSPAVRITTATFLGNLVAPKKLQDRAVRFTELCRGPLPEDPQADSVRLLTEEATELAGGVTIKDRVAE